MKSGVLGICLALFGLVPFVANAQSRKEDEQVHAAQARQYWTDPATGLSWASKDNGRDVSWKNAMKYCRKMRLAGDTDWRLATLSELESIYDRTSNTPGLSMGNDFKWHVKGNLFLAGDQWSSEYRIDDRGKPSGYSWYFNFNEGRKDNDPSGWPYSSSGRHALCVRSSDK